MDGMLKAGEKLHSGTSGREIVIEEYLGGGGQGEVYRASIGGNPVAVKWYLPQSATAEQKDILQSLITAGPPSETFLWPTELVGSNLDKQSSFGYMMRLRDQRYHGMVDLLKARVDPSFRALAKVGHELAANFQKLHAKGLCYRDISFGNVFFDPQAGDVLICDNDNVAPNGAKYSGVLGTMQFMAPEIVRGDDLPSTQTDLHSLAVLLFYMFMVNHPLEGARESQIHCLDQGAMLKLFGTQPVFIFDPHDDSNRPDSYHANACTYWNIYPQFLQDLFIQAFTDGLRNPGERVREGQWKQAMIRLHDSIVYCRNSSCRAENFYDSSSVNTPTQLEKPCWSCHQPIPIPMRLDIGHNEVVLTRATQMFPHHTEGVASDLSRVTAEVTQHPADPTVYGLTNRSAERWAVTLPDGRMQEVDPGRSVRISQGTRIHFGKAEGVIQL